ncbi:MAG: hypothetical protein QXK57_04505 [Conexivisphaerales archaeon]
MNEGKREKPYAYSDALMLLAVKEYFGLQADRGLRCLVEYGEPGYHPIPRSAEGRRG